MGLKDNIRQLLMAIVPGPTRTLQAIRARRHIVRYEASQGLRRIANDYVSRHGRVICRGPFVGMKLERIQSSGGYVAKLLGAYESELFDVVERIISREYEVIVDVGSAEGYYAVGFAIRLPQATCWAFDLDPNARRATKLNALANRVRDRVTVRKACTPETLVPLCGRRALVWSDCEGYEGELLDLSRVPALQVTDILVETHDHERAGVTAELIQRFSKTHFVTVITPAALDVNVFPELQHLTEAERITAAVSPRPEGQRWLWMQTKIR